MLHIIGVAHDYFFDFLGVIPISLHILGVIAIILHIIGVIEEKANYWGASHKSP